MWTPTYYAGQLNRGIVGLPTDVPVWISVVVLTALIVFLELAKTAHYRYLEQSNEEKRRLLDSVCEKRRLLSPNQQHGLIV